MKSAENQGDNDKAARLKKDVALQRQLMDTIVKTALDIGHPMIVEKYDLPPPILQIHLIPFISLVALVSFVCTLFLARALHTPRSSKKNELITHVICLLWRWTKSKFEIIWLQLKSVLILGTMAMRLAGAGDMVSNNIPCPKKPNNEHSESVMESFLFQEPSISLFKDTQSLRTF
jgi:hypothetical protein